MERLEPGMMMMMMMIEANSGVTINEPLPVRFLSEAISTPTIIASRASRNDVV